MRPDITLIFTAFDDFEGDPSSDPEKNLMLAILSTAIADFKQKGQVYQSAKNYLMSDEDNYIYSFISVCSHLNVCPKIVRKYLGLPPGKPERELTKQAKDIEVELRNQRNSLNIT